jgi:hypothetical protein
LPGLLFLYPKTYSMKPIFKLAIAALLFFSTHISAQSIFAPPGCEWYQAMPYGTFHCYYTGDTVISGITARKIVQKAYTANPWLSLGLRVSDLPDLFLYNNADTVFVYNHIYSRFTPLYVFNVHQGDTVTLPALPADPLYMGPSVTDSFFRFVVDSIKVVTYDTAHLKTIYTTPIDPGYLHYYFFYGSDSAHRYAEKIGSVYGGIIPVCGHCTRLATDAIQLPDTIRCYNDPALSIKLTTGICGKDYTAVAEVGNNNGFGIYPNPASGVLHIRFAGTANTFTLTLYNIMGSIVFKQPYTQTDRADIGVETLSVGIYYLMVKVGDMPPEMRKVIIEP